MLIISLWMQLGFVPAVPKYFISATFWSIYYLSLYYDFCDEIYVYFAFSTFTSELTLQATNRASLFSMIFRFLPTKNNIISINQKLMFHFSHLWCFLDLYNGIFVNVVLLLSFFNISKNLVIFVWSPLIPVYNKGDRSDCK
jgi:hypothetical protein